MNMDQWNEEHAQRMQRIRDNINMNRLVQHARWLVLFGHHRRGWPKTDPDA